MRTPKKKTVKFVKDKYWILLLALIILVASGFRFVGINWGENHHLHPDERFLSMVTNDIKWPPFDKYFDYQNSTLNPHHNAGFFIYGTFPIFLTKFIGDVTKQSTYDDYPIVGRTLSSIFDILTIIVLFLIARELFDVKTALLSAFLLAISVTNIQHSHFYVVDLFAAFFLTLSFYFILLWVKTEKLVFSALTGVSIGFATASKISAVLFLPIIALACIIVFIRDLRKKLATKNKKNNTIIRIITTITVSVIVLLAIGFVIFRIFQPYAFTGPHVWNVNISEGFASSYKTQQGFNNPEARYPPVYQWRNRSPLFQISNITFWGLGIPLSIICWMGVLLGLCHLISRKKWMLLLPLSWAIFLITFHATQFAKYGRYLLPIIPFLVLFGAYFLSELYTFLLNSSIFKMKRTARKKMAIGIVSAILILCLFWTLAFTHIYLNLHPRSVASDWIFDSLPINATVANEHWDDNLPFYPPQGRFKTEILGLYEPDTDAKIEILSKQLSRTDYIFITSNRLYGSIMRLPEFWNVTPRYYTLLFNGDLGYTLDKNFTNYPSLFGVEINDDNSEEAFTVYDHTKVLIYKNEKRLSKKELKDLINATG